MKIISRAVGIRILLECLLSMASISKHRYDSVPFALDHTESQLPKTHCHAMIRHQNALAMFIRGIHPPERPPF